MKESDLYTPLKEGLAQLGLEVYGEVSLSYGKAIDCVALKDRKFLIGIELKLTNSKKLIKQVYRTSKYCHHVFAATPTIPDADFLTRLKRCGCGFIHIADNMLQMLQQPKLLSPKRNIILHPAYKGQLGGVASGVTDKKTIFQYLYSDIETYLLKNEGKAVHIGKILQHIRSYCFGKITKTRVNRIIEISPNIFQYNSNVMYLKNYNRYLPYELKQIIEEAIRKGRNDGLSE